MLEQIQRNVRSHAKREPTLGGKGPMVELTVRLVDSRKREVVLSYQVEKGTDLLLAFIKLVEGHGGFADIGYDPRYGHWLKKVYFPKMKFEITDFGQVYINGKFPFVNFGGNQIWLGMENIVLSKNICIDYQDDKVGCCSGGFASSPLDDVGIHTIGLRVSNFNLWDPVTGIVSLDNEMKYDACESLSLIPEVSTEFSVCRTPYYLQSLLEKYQHFYSTKTNPVNVQDRLASIEYPAPPTDFNSFDDAPKKEEKGADNAQSREEREDEHHHRKEILLPEQQSHIETVHEESIIMRLLMNAAKNWVERKLCCLLNNEVKNEGNNRKNLGDDRRWKSFDELKIGRDEYVNDRRKVAIMSAKKVIRRMYTERIGVTYGLLTYRPKKYYTKEKAAEKEEKSKKRPAKKKGAVVSRKSEMQLREKKEQKKKLVKEKKKVKEKLANRMKKPVKKAVEKEKKKELEMLQKQKRKVARKRAKRKAKVFEFGSPFEKSSIAAAERRKKKLSKHIYYYLLVKKKQGGKKKVFGPVAQLALN